MALFDFIIIPESIGTIGRTHGVKESNNPKPRNKRTFATILFANSLSYITSDSEIFPTFEYSSCLFSPKLKDFFLGG